MQAMMASTMTKGETAVVFSYSGATKDTIQDVYKRQPLLRVDGRPS